MGYQEDFYKALKAAENGEISQDELLSITKRIIREMSPEPITEEEAEKFAKAAIDPSSCTIMVSSPDGPAYGDEQKSYKNDYFMAIDDAHNGRISKDELSSIVKKIVLEINPGIDEHNADELTQMSIYPSYEHDLPDGKYELPGGGALQIGAPKEKKMEISPETKVKLDRLLARVDELIEPVESVRLVPSRSKTTVFDSKLGGVPYFPKSMEYPTVREGELAGRPLFLLAQLNFGELPKLPGFPTEGILQFFAGYPGDDVYGMDFKDGFNQNGFRVIYHENIITDESKLYSEQDMPDFGEEEDPYPFKGEFLLTAEEAAPMGIAQSDFRFDKAVAAAYNELFGGDVIGMFDFKGHRDIRHADEALYDAIFSRYNCKTRIGGYPFFTQEDPRGYNDEYAKCTIMLFQSDSESGGEKGNWDDEICWGDCGVANFFISPEDLSKRDFSRVLYNWDCT